MMKIFQLSIIGLLFVFLISCKKEENKNCYKVTTISSACQGIVVQFSDKKIKDQNRATVPNIIELVNVPNEFNEKGAIFYIRFDYDEKIANASVICPQVYGSYKTYVCKYASKSSCNDAESNNEKN